MAKTVRQVRTDDYGNPVRGRDGEPIIDTLPAGGGSEWDHQTRKHFGLGDSLRIAFGRTR